MKNRDFKGAFFKWPVVILCFLVSASFDAFAFQQEKFFKIVVAQKISGRINCGLIKDMGYEISNELKKSCIDKTVPIEIAKLNKTIAAEVYLVGGIDERLEKGFEILKVLYATPAVNYLYPNGTLLSFSKRYAIPLRKDPKGSVYFEECDAVSLEDLKIIKGKTLEEMYTEAVNLHKSFCEASES